jgi:hypothetical protein
VGIATDHGGFGLREELDVDKQELGARRERLELPAIDREMLASIVDNFEKVMAEGPNPKKEAPPPPAGEEGAYSDSANHRNLVPVTKYVTVRRL